MITNSPSIHRLCARDRHRYAQWVKSAVATLAFLGSSAFGQAPDGAGLLSDEISPALPESFAISPAPQACREGPPCEVGRERIHELKEYLAS